MRNRALIFEQARLKGLELEALHNAPDLALTPESPVVPAPETGPVPQTIVVHQFPAVSPPPNLELPAAHLIWRGIESYLQEIIGNAVRSELASFGLTPRPAIRTSQPVAFTPPLPGPGEREPAKPATPKDGTLISEAIDSYLKNVEPPQREPKTYDEYRLVLYKFRDTCSKRHVEEIGRDDLLEFRRQLYAIGNEARTVFNRMGIVLQLLRLHGIERLLKKGDKPKFVRNVREMYQPEDLEALFGRLRAG